MHPGYWRLLPDLQFGCAEPLLRAEPAALGWGSVLSAGPLAPATVPDGPPLTRYRRIIVTVVG